MSDNVNLLLLQQLNQTNELLILHAELQMAAISDRVDCTEFAWRLGRIKDIRKVEKQAE